MDLQQFYQDLLEWHNTRLFNLRERWHRSLITEDEARAAFGAEMLAWRDTMQSLLPFYTFYTTFEGNVIPEDLRKGYDTDKNFPLCGVILYRDQKIPYYVDDYGQQVFGKFNGHEISTGAYNFNYCEDLVSAVDYYIDKAFVFGDGE